MRELACPLCQLELKTNASGVACVNKHQFDRAREGYFNLLPVHHKNSKAPGESKEQMQARRQFLAAGHFDPLAEKIINLIPSNLGACVDIGCGEGFFSKKIAEHCNTATTYAVDISKPAIQLAAKHSNHLFIPLVASNFKLPFASGSIDFISRILAPSVESEVHRVLQPTGIFLVVRPQVRHLENLRKQIYSELRPYQEATVPEGFSIQTELDVAFDLKLANFSDAECLLRMTPFAWRLKQEDLASLCKNGWQDFAEFKISLYKKSE